MPFEHTIIYASAIFASTSDAVQGVGLRGSLAPPPRRPPPPPPPFLNIL